ncbi:Zn-binding domain-containing protein [Streptomyces sp. NPDC059755]|uniref:Zn-binding domain-containing protein n=1 Tax=Streptomyces sp. NPDC059755 TaxID=3346934 RepID=UPI0036557B26
MADPGLDAGRVGEPLSLGGLPISLLAAGFTCSGTAKAAGYLAAWSLHFPVIPRPIWARTCSESSASCRRAFILRHTLAHLLVNQLTYECGYSSASLRERLYVSPGPDDMAGILIYTAAGDSEGTLGAWFGRASPVGWRERCRTAWHTLRGVPRTRCASRARAKVPDPAILPPATVARCFQRLRARSTTASFDRALVVGGLGRSELGFFVTNWEEVGGVRERLIHAHHLRLALHLSGSRGR